MITEATLAGLGLGLSGLNMVGGLFSDLYGIVDNERRWKLEKQAVEAQQDLAERQFLETQKYNAYNQFLSQNGVQVRANDLARAGLSKVLASGSTPSYVSAGTAGSISTPNLGQGMKLNALMQSLQMVKDFQQKDAQLQLLQAQKKSMDLDNAYKQFENNYWEGLGIPASADFTLKRGLGIFDKVKSFFDKVEPTDTSFLSEGGVNLKELPVNFIKKVDDYLHSKDLDRYRPQEDRVKYKPTDNDYIKNYPKENKKYAEQNDIFTFRDKYRYVQKRRGRY